MFSDALDSFVLRQRFLFHVSETGELRRLEKESKINGSMNDCRNRISKSNIIYIGDVFCVVLAIHRVHQGMSRCPRNEAQSDMVHISFLIN